MIYNLYLYISIHYRMITMIRIVTICHHSVIIIFLIIFPMLVISSLWFHSFWLEVLSLHLPHLFYSFSPCPFLLATTCLFSVSTDLFPFYCVHSLVLFFRFHIWMKSYGICLWFILFSIIHSRPIHVITNDKISFFLWLNKHICMAEHIYILNSVVIHTYICIYIYTHTLPWLFWITLKIWVFVFFAKTSRIEIPQLRGSLFLIFWGSSILFSSGSALIYFPTKSTQRFSFLHILTST